MKKNFTKRLLKFNKLSRKRLKKHPYAIPVVGLLVGFILVMGAVIFSGGQTVGANDSYVVNVVVDGVQKTVPTRAKTVGELAEKLKLDLIKEDIIEPSLGTEILSDGFNVTVYRAKPVTIIDGDKRISTLSAQKIPRLIVARAGLAIYPEDEARFENGNIREDGILGQRVVVDRATPVNFNVYGTVVAAHTRSKTVADLLKEKQVKLAKDDTLSPSAETVITPGMNVFVTRVGKQLVTRQEQIPMPIDYVEDAGLNVGQIQVREPGSPGSKVVTYELDIQNGKEVSRRVIQEVIITQPVRQLSAKGTKVVVAVYAGDKAGLMAAAGISPGEYAAVDYIIGRESGWKVNARNGGGCFGLGQACPGSKLVNACPNWQSDGVCQLRFFGAYASRYGGWNGAYSFWRANGWW